MIPKAYGISVSVNIFEYVSKKSELQRKQRSHNFPFSILFWHTVVNPGWKIEASSAIICSTAAPNFFLGGSWQKKIVQSFFCFLYVDRKNLIKQLHKLSLWKNASHTVFIQFLRISCQSNRITSDLFVVLVKTFVHCIKIEEKVKKKTWEKLLISHFTYMEVTRLAFYDETKLIFIIV